MKFSFISTVVLFVMSVSSAQQVQLVSPADDTILSQDSVNFSCEVSNSSGIDSVYLYSDLSGSWAKTAGLRAPRNEYPFDATMQLWMHFNESSGLINDFSNHSHDGAVQGATFVPAGYNQGAYSFNGGRDCISMPSSTFNLPGASGATMAAWVKPFDGQSSASGAIIFIDYSGSANTRILLTVNSNKTVSMKARSRTEALQTTTSANSLQTNIWTHIAGVVDLSAKTIQVYINGNMAKEETKSFNSPTFYETTAINACIGGISGSSSYSFKGDVDEAAMYNRVLSGSEILTLAQDTLVKLWSPVFTVTPVLPGRFNPEFNCCSRERDGHSLHCKKPRHDRGSIEFDWNCQAIDGAGNPFWAIKNFDFTDRKPFTFDYVHPTPGDDTLIQKRSATIKIKASDALSSSSLVLLKGQREKIYRIAVDSTLWSKWGLEYPVTYVFELTDISDLNVWQRDTSADAWQLIPSKIGTEIFNGVDAVRLCSDQKTLYVSIGFKTRPVIFLKFGSTGKITYQGAARFYDNRKATFTLSIDNWGYNNLASPNAHAGIPCASMTDDNGDKYQAAVWACRSFQLPVSVAIVTRSIDMTPVWPLIQDEVNAGAMEPASHSCHHSSSALVYQIFGYTTEIIASRDDILTNLTNLPYGNHIFEYVLPGGYENTTIFQTAQGEYSLLRRYNGYDDPSDTGYAVWNAAYQLYLGGQETKSYDTILEARNPKARYYAADVDSLNSAFTTVYNNGGIFYAMWHPDRYTNSVIYDISSPIEGAQGSSLMQHLSYVSGRTDVWYVANGWLYDYHLAAGNVNVTEYIDDANPVTYKMDIEKCPPDVYAVYNFHHLASDSSYYYRVTAQNVHGDSAIIPASPNYRRLQVITR
jgi:hypothetical protein